MADRTDTVYFSSKGQIVIPRWLRKEFEIEGGTRAQVAATADGILIKPLTAKSIRALRGSLKGTGAMDALIRERQKR
jgi:AbrB family looped-hinge helix DNA binding protein